MTRLIDADIFVETLIEIDQALRDMPVKLIVKAIEITPKVDAVPVIRCKECKHWKANTQFCAVFSGISTVHRMPPNGFCSEAVKKDERQDTATEAV